MNSWKGLKKLKSTTMPTQTGSNFRVFSSVRMQNQTFLNNFSDLRIFQKTHASRNVYFKEIFWLGPEISGFIKHFILNTNTNVSV